MLRDPHIYKVSGKKSVFREDAPCNLGVLLAASSHGNMNPDSRILWGTFMIFFFGTASNETFI